MKVFIIGRTEMLYRTIEMLAEHHSICGIITAPAAPEYEKTAADFEDIAARLNCPFLMTNKIDERALKLIEEARPDIAVSVNWVSIIDKNVTSLIPLGILNSHFGDLPRYRGNAIANWALLNFEPVLTLTIHFMEPGELDSGDILLQRHLPLSEETTIKDIVEFDTLNTPEMFMEAINMIEAGTIKVTSQAETGKKPFRCYPRLPIDSKIDWSWSARDIHALVRASTLPYSGAFSYLKIGNEIKKVYIWKTRIVANQTEDIGTPGHIVKNDPSNGESWVMTGKGIIAICSAQYEDGTIFMPGNTWKSIRSRFGIDAEAEIIKIHNLLSKLVSENN